MTVFPTSIVNLGRVHCCIDQCLDSKASYRSFGLSEHASKVLAQNNSRDYPLEEFFWLDKKWLKFHTGSDARTLREVRELLGGFFMEMSLTDQCDLLEVPLYKDLPMAVLPGEKSRKKWISRHGWVTPEQCVKDILTDHFKIAINDEGEHLRAWHIILNNMILEARELNGEKMFPKDWGSPAQKLRDHAEMVRLAKNMSEVRFFSLMKEQIKTQIEGSWWSSSYGLEETMTAAHSWGKDRLIEISEQAKPSSGVPDLILFDGAQHTLLEIKTTDRLHQSQAAFIRNSQASQLDLNICLVSLKPSLEEMSPDLQRDFVSWVLNDLEDH